MKKLTQCLRLLLLIWPKIKCSIRIFFWFIRWKMVVNVLPVAPGKWNRETSTRVPGLQSYLSHMATAQRPISSLSICHGKHRHSPHTGRRGNVAHGGALNLLDEHVLWNSRRSLVYKIKQTSQYRVAGELECVRLSFDLFLTKPFLRCCFPGCLEFANFLLW